MTVSELIRGNRDSDENFVAFVSPRVHAPTLAFRKVFDCSWVYAGQLEVVYFLCTENVAPYERLRMDRFLEVCSEFQGVFHVVLEEILVDRLAGRNRCLIESELLIRHRLADDDGKVKLVDYNISIYEFENLSLGVGSVC